MPTGNPAFDSIVESLKDAHDKTSWDDTTRAIKTAVRKSPARGVVSVIQQGAWGHTSYLHLLTCGHSVSRPRKAAGPVRCVKCYEPPRDFEDERDVQVCESRLAAALGVTGNDVKLSVDATSGTLRLKGATVWLGDEQVRKLLRKR